MNIADSPRGALWPSAEPDSTLRFFQRPGTVALYGASDGSQWSNSIFRAVRGYGFDGPMVVVNQRGASAHGLAGYTSARQIPGQVDMAYVYVPAQGVVEAFEDLAAVGVKTVVVLSSGFSEIGDEGALRQQAVLETAQRLGIQFMGPNSLGFANISAGYGVTALPPPEPLLAGSVAIVSQSGAICSEIAEYAVQQGIGLSFICAVGNEAMVDASAVVDALIDDEATRAIALFAESIRSPAAFVRAAKRARSRAKPIVVFKVGASAIGAAVAQAHTGSMVGDDRVFDAVCRRHGVVRVNSIEDLVTTAALLSHTGIVEKGVALVSLSGGACGIFADYAEAHGLDLPVFSDETVAALRNVLPSYAATLNPFDITGAAVRDPRLFAECLRIVGADPGIGLTVCGYSVFNDERRLTPRLPMIDAIGEGLRSLGCRGVLMSAAVRPYAEPGVKALRAAGIEGAFGGVHATVKAIEKAMWWSRAMRANALAEASDAETAPAEPQEKPTRPQTERQVLEFLAGFGVPVIPAVVVTSAAGAVQAQQDWGSPVAMKIVSPDIQHKTEVGGVVLNVEGADAVARAHASMLAQVSQLAPKARIDGVIVSPMRSRGSDALELFVGTARDPHWGPVIVVGLGGIWIEALNDSALSTLPVRREQAIEMLRGLRGARLLEGFRGAEPADMQALADVIVRIGAAALALGPELVALEVNPLRVQGSAMEALDGLAIWETTR